MRLKVHDARLRTIALRHVYITTFSVLVPIGSFSTVAGCRLHDSGGCSERRLGKPLPELAEYCIYLTGAQVIG